MSLWVYNIKIEDALNFSLPQQHVYGTYGSQSRELIKSQYLFIQHNLVHFQVRWHNPSAASDIASRHQLS